MRRFGKSGITQKGIRWLGEERNFCYKLLLFTTKNKYVGKELENKMHAGKKKIIKSANLFFKLFKYSSLYKGK